MAKKKIRKLSYWEKRAVNQEEYVHRGLEPKEQKITNAYLKAQRYLTAEVKKIYNRYLNKSEMTEKDVKKVLNTSVRPDSLIELQRLSKTVMDKQIKEQTQTYLNGLAVKHRITRLEDLKAKSFLVSKQVADVQLEISTDYYIDVIRDAYNQSSAESIIGQTDKKIRKDFEIHDWQDGPVKFERNQKVPNYSIKNNKPIVEIYDWQKQKVVKTIELKPDVPVQEFKQLSAKYVNNILESQWQGSNYSKRIWNDTELLAKRLEELFTVEAMTGMSEQEMAKAIAKEFNQSIGIARRLIRTEANYMAGQAKLKGWKEHGVKQYVIVAVLDFRTSEICQGQDGKIYDVDKAVCNGKDGNYPPFHPWCRTVVRAYFGKATLQGDRTAIDRISGETFKIKQSTMYREWEQMLIDKHSQKDVELFKKMAKNYKSDSAQYKRYKELVGEKNIPKTFDKFQKMKYTKDREWEQLRLKTNLQNLINKGSLSLDINVDKQLRHELNHSSYDTYVENNKRKGKPIPSYFKSDVSDIQEIVNKNYLNGEIQRRNSGQYSSIIEVDRNDLAVAYSSDRINSRATNRFKIHISKNTTHVVPMYPKEE